jgi:hypothetical protein
MGATQHCPRNAAFVRQSGVEGRFCRMNAAFRTAAAPNLEAVTGGPRGAAGIQSPLDSDSGAGLR